MLFCRDKNKMRDDKPLYRLDRLLKVLQDQHPQKRLKECGVEAIVCNDGIVLLNLDAKGFGVSMVNSVITLDFNLDLTDEEIQDFNGGAGLRERYFPYRN